MSKEPCPGCTPENCECAAAKLVAQQKYITYEKYELDTDFLIQQGLIERAKRRELEQRLAAEAKEYARLQEQHTEMMGMWTRLLSAVEAHDADNPCVYDFRMHWSTFR